MPEEGEDLWGAIQLNEWQSTPCVVGRCATEADVRGGRAVFFVLEGSSEAIDTTLPRCALLHEDEGTSPVVIIQVEKSGVDGMVLVGYRPIGGSNGICTYPEVEILDGPNEDFG